MPEDNRLKVYVAPYEGHMDLAGKSTSLSGVFYSAGINEADALPGFLSQRCETERELKKGGANIHILLNVKGIQEINVPGYRVTVQPLEQIANS